MIAYQQFGDLQLWYYNENMELMFWYAGTDGQEYAKRSAVGALDDVREMLTVASGEMLYDTGDA